MWQTLRELFLRLESFDANNVLFQRNVTQRAMQSRYYTKNYLLRTGPQNVDVKNAFQVVLSFDFFVGVYLKMRIVTNDS